MKLETIVALVLIIVTICALIYALIYYNFLHKKRSAELFIDGDNTNKKEDCELYEVNKKLIISRSKDIMTKYHLAAAVLLHKHKLNLKDTDDLTREQLEQMPNYNSIKDAFFPGGTQLGITAFNELLRRTFDYSTGRLLDDSIRSQLQDLDNQCDNVPNNCHTDTTDDACRAINEMMDGSMQTIREMVESKSPDLSILNKSSSSNNKNMPGGEIENAPRATNDSIKGVPPADETSPDLGVDGAEASLASNRKNALDPRTDLTFGIGKGPQSPKMVGEGRADLADPSLNRDAQRLYKFVLDKLSALYRDGDAGGNFQAGLSPDLFAAIDGLNDNQRAALCSAYCGQFTPCSELCRYMNCINCTVGNTPRDRQNPGNTGGGIGDPQIDMRGMVLPGAARVTDDYMLLDSKVIKYQAVPSKDSQSGDMSRQGFLKGLIGMGDDMKGVVNVFAPTVNISSPSATNPNITTAVSSS